MEEYAVAAIQSVLNSKQSYCKFLSANDSGATGGHQSGILISMSAKTMLFHEGVQNENIAKRTIRIKWQNDFYTDSRFTYYSSKNELRITSFGKGFPFLRPDQTGSLFVLTRQSESDYCGFFLDAEDEINQFLDAFGLSPADTNRIIDTSQIQADAHEQAEIQNFIAALAVDFPASEEMSAAARAIHDRVYDHVELIQKNPDSKIIGWTNTEFALFRAIEYARYGEVIARGFTTVDDFVTMANMVLNRRKSRAGKSLEHHLAAIFDGNQLSYTPQAVTEGNKKPDFIFPSQESYHNAAFPAEKLVSLAAKTTCKDRWRQIITEADRLRDMPKYLCTLQQGISPAQMDEMQAANVVLVVPAPYINTYPKDRRNRIWTITRFVEYVREVEGV